MNFNNLSYDWIDAMKTCIQDPVFHAEGDVWTHTLMVLDESKKFDLNDEDRDILEWAILLHDMAKPQTRVIEDHVRHPKHALKAADFAGNFLWRQGFSFEKMYKIRALVRYHSKPVHDCDVRELSCDVSLKLLAILAECDMRGRIGPIRDIDAALFKIDYFRELCKEYNCFEQPFFGNYARFKSRSYDGYAHFDNTWGDCFLTCGVPGSGKSTLCKEYNVVSLDELRVKHGISPEKNQGTLLQIAKEECKKYLRKHESFVFDATNLISDLRIGWLSLMNEYNASPKIILPWTSPNVAFERNMKRENSVPVGVWNKMADSFEPPWKKEAVEIILP